MNGIGKLQPTADAPATPETVAIAALTTSATVQDYPAGKRFVYIDVTVQSYINMSSTAVHVPSASIAATTSSSGLVHILNPGYNQLFQIPSGSTGYSLITPSTDGVATLRFHGTP